MKEQEIYALRILKDQINWQEILNKAKIYHFSGYHK